ncbi:MAG TPA: sortase, partial [Caldilineaceae bacterium]|nr:sortase [Caldilineaceae bacterium]
GHQVAGSAPLALLAQGAVEPGQEILLTDEAGVVFVYRVVEVTDPIPLTGASAEEEAQAESYAAPSDQALLTLITGWPDFTTTHRVFAVAELVGLQN